jgi:hypothetical protein
MSLNDGLYTRSDAYLVKKPGQVAKYYFWTIDPVYGGPGYYIREHQQETGGYGRSSMRVTEDMGEAAALAKLAQFDRDAAAQYPRCDEKAAGMQEKLRDDYFKAVPYRQRITTEMRDAQLQSLKNRGKGLNLKLGPK